MELSLEKKLEICNAVNALTANGYKIRIADIAYDGATMINGQLMFIQFNETEPDMSRVWTISETCPITATKTAIIDVKMVYNPASSIDAE